METRRWRRWYLADLSSFMPRADAAADATRRLGPAFRLMAGDVDAAVRCRELDAAAAAIHPPFELTAALPACRLERQVVVHAAAAVHDVRRDVRLRALRQPQADPSVDGPEAPAVVRQGRQANLDPAVGGV